MDVEAVEPSMEPTGTQDSTLAPLPRPRPSALRIRQFLLLAPPQKGWRLGAGVKHLLCFEPAEVQYLPESDPMTEEV